MADGDTVTVYVSSKDPLVSSSVPKEVTLAAVKRAKAREKRNYTEADALHKTIIASGYRFVFVLYTIHKKIIESMSYEIHNISKPYCVVLRMISYQNEEVLAKKFRIRLR